MKIRMLTVMSGSYNGVEYPPVGGELTMTDHEAAAMCAAGFAEPVAAVPAVEAAALDTAPRKRAARKS